ncbi:hypothetical protein RSOLAG1IB_08809 [Rhizoctonia solani AG-1 IB]|uniref:Uncharacterized protein n=1 Tax=Thanatephorus cucumeris (strain AG1-IB / isolate 7/3/14) TaxID=1108050 RepID=A0A0B7FRB3_THACB|nr:hypothetical protein RSOLAG1IB_08809 [Rhizoctonia solani AG-1 IB]
MISIRVDHAITRSVIKNPVTIALQFGKAFLGVIYTIFPFDREYVSNLVLSTLTYKYSERASARYVSERLQSCTLTSAQSYS